jgi:hypothetical protein
MITAMLEFLASFISWVPTLVIISSDQTTNLTFLFLLLLISQYVYKCYNLNIYHFGGIFINKDI